MISSHSLDSSRLRRGDVCTGGLPVTPLVSAAHDGAGRSEIRPQRPHEGDVIDIDNPRRLQKADVIGRDGTKLGTVSAVYYDNNTDHPAWVAVRTGLFGTHVSVVPLVAAELQGEELYVPFDKQQLKSEPHHDP